MAFGFGILCWYRNMALALALVLLLGMGMGMGIGCAIAFALGEAVCIQFLCVLFVFDSGVALQRSPILLALYVFFHQFLVAQL